MIRSAVPLAVLAVLLGGGVGCGVRPADGAPDFGEGAAAYVAPAPADLSVWAADTELWAWVQTVAPRIERATGLRVAPAAADTSGPGDEDGWLGWTHVEQGHPDWLAIDPGTPMALREAVVLHEVLHALGAGHVGTGEGVLSPQLWARDGGWSLTAADVEAVCAVARCTAFSPEAG